MTKYGQIVGIVVISNIDNNFGCAQFIAANKNIRMWSKAPNQRIVIIVTYRK